MSVLRDTECILVLTLPWPGRRVLIFLYATILNTVVRRLWRFIRIQHAKVDTEARIYVIAYSTNYMKVYNLFITFPSKSCLKIVDSIAFLDGVAQRSTVQITIRSLHMK